MHSLMKLTRLSGLFSNWIPAQQKPARSGWYRVRTEHLTGAWWNLMAYFDGHAWWEYGRRMSVGLAVRRKVKPRQWQGLALGPKEAVALIHANLPKSSVARRRWLRMAAVLEMPAAVPR